MFGRHVFSKMLVGLLVIALLVGGVSATQRTAWTQGYLMGRASTGSDGGTVAPALPYGYPGYPAYPGHFGGFGLILGFGLLALLFLGVGRVFRYRSWAMHGGSNNDSRGAHDQSWQRHMAEWQRWAQEMHAEHAARPWRHGPPWCWDREGKPGTETPKPETAEASASDRL